MRRKLKFILVTIVLLASILLITGGQAKAVLQANPNTNYKTGKALVYTATDGGTEGWLTAIRKMEVTGGAMGLTGSIIESTLAGPSNGIDVHCIKNTEYGTMAILSASAYGNPSNDRAITTTTGNNTGIILDTTKWEWTANVGDKQYLYGSISAKTCYYDLYTTGELTVSTAKVGDALVDYKGWHSASTAIWLNNSAGGFRRGNGGIFSFIGYVGGLNGAWFYGVYGNSYSARAVAVCGQGL